MRVLIITPYTDPAGVGITLKRAFDRWTDHEVRFVRRRSNWLGYPPDVLWRDERRLVIDLFARADVVHMFDTILPDTEDKPRLVHHHGSRFWVDDAVGDATRAGVPIFGSTHDLTPHGVTWVPNPVVIDEMQAIRDGADHGAPLIMQTPTRRELKDTDAFLAAAEGLPHEVVDEVPWEVSLRRKARASVLFDSFRFGYGNTSLEAWGMGIPTVSGVSDPAIEDSIRSAIGYLPYLSATPETLREQLVAILADEALRESTRTAGWGCVNDFHDARKVVARWERIYEQVIG